MEGRQWLVSVTRAREEDAEGVWQAEKPTEVGNAQEAFSTWVPVPF